MAEHLPPRNNRPHPLPARIVTSKSPGPQLKNSPPRPPTRNTPPHPLPVRISMVGFPNLSPWRNPPHPPPIQIAIAEPPEPPPINNPPHPLPVRNWVFPDEVWKTIKNSPNQEPYDLPLISTNDHAPVSVNLKMDLGTDNTKTDIDAFKVSESNTPQERDAPQERNTDVLQDAPSEEDREKQLRAISDKRLASRAEKRAARLVAADFYDIDEDEPIDFHGYYRARLGLPLQPMKNGGVQMGGNEDKLSPLTGRLETPDEASNDPHDDGRVLLSHLSADLGPCFHRTFEAPPSPPKILIPLQDQPDVAANTTSHLLGDKQPTDEDKQRKPSAQARICMNCSSPSSQTGGDPDMTGSASGFSHTHGPESEQQDVLNNQGTENEKKRKETRRQKNRKRRKLNYDAADDIILCADEQRLIAEENQQKELARRAGQREREKRKLAESIAKEKEQAPIPVVAAGEPFHQI